MKHFITISIFFTLFYLISCSGSNKDDQTDIPLEDSSTIIINVDQIEKSKDIFASTLFKSIEPIILENKNGGAFGRIDKMFTNDSLIVILDSGVAKNVLVFDINGKYLYKIGDTGRGRGEFIAPIDFTIDKKRNIIYILDSRADVINSYNLLTGQFIKRVSYKTTPSVRSYNIFVTDTTIWADAFFSNANEENFLLRELSTENGAQLATYYKKNQFNKAFGENYAYERNMQTGDKYITYLSEYVLKLECGKATPFLKIESDKFVDRECVENLTGKNVWFRLNNLRKRDRIHYISNYIEFNDKIMLTYYEKDKYLTLLHDTTTDSSFLANRIFDDLLITPRNKDYIFTKWFYFDQKNRCGYSVIGSSYLKNFVLAREHGTLSDSIATNPLMREINENCNPIVLKYKY